MPEFARCPGAGARVRYLGGPARVHRWTQHLVVGAALRGGDGRSGPLERRCGRFCSRLRRWLRLLLTRAGFRHSLCARRSLCMRASGRCLSSAARWLRVLACASSRVARSVDRSLLSVLTSCLGVFPRPCLAGAGCTPTRATHHRREAALQGALRLVCSVGALGGGHRTFASFEQVDRCVVGERDGGRCTGKVAGGGPGVRRHPCERQVQVPWGISWSEFADTNRRAVQRLARRAWRSTWTSCCPWT